MTGYGKAIAEIPGKKVTIEIKSLNSKQLDLSTKVPLIFRDKEGFLRLPYENGGIVLRKAVEKMGRSVEYLKEWAFSGQSALVIPHQANGRITANVKKRLKEGDEIVDNIEYLGNMSAAGCVIALNDYVTGRKIPEHGRVILTGFGAGLVTSAVAMQL